MDVLLLQVGSDRHARLRTAGGKRHQFGTEQNAERLRGENLPAELEYVLHQSLNVSVSVNYLRVAAIERPTTPANDVSKGALKPPRRSDAGGVCEVSGQRTVAQLHRLDGAVTRSDAPHQTGTCEEHERDQWNSSSKASGRWSPAAAVASGSQSQRFSRRRAS
jgi:hypothetical protein